MANQGALQALLDEVFGDIEHLIGGNPAFIDRGTLDRYRSAAAAILAGGCCDLHGRNCEPGEQCCRYCTEARHLNWTDERGAARARSAGYALATALGGCGARVTIHETTRLAGGGESDRLTATLADGTQVGMDVRFEDDA